MGEETQTAEDKPLVLIVADADRQTGFYRRVVDSFGYATISVHDEWNTNSDLQTARDDGIPHAGPLYAEFMESLAKKAGQKYAAVVVDMMSSDLIGAMRKGGHKGGFVICGTPFTETSVPYVPIHPDEFKPGLQQKLAEIISQPQDSP